MKIDLKYFENLGDEELSKLTRQQLIRRLKKANQLAVERRSEALEYLKNNPDVPTPLIYKNYTKTVRPKHGAIDWKNYDFDFENGETLNQLRHKLITTRNFLNAKTSSIQGWLNTLQDLTIQIGKDLGISVDVNELSGYKYKRLWRVFNKVIESNPNLASSHEDSTQLRNMIFRTMTQKEYRGYGVDRLTNVIESMIDDNYMNRTGELSDIIDEEEYQELLQQVYGGLGRQY